MSKISQQRNIGAIQTYNKATTLYMMKNYSILCHIWWYNLIISITSFLSSLNLLFNFLVLKRAWYFKLSLKIFLFEIPCLNFKSSVYYVQKQRVISREKSCRFRELNYILYIVIPGSQGILVSASYHISHVANQWHMYTLRTCNHNISNVVSFPKSAIFIWK